MSDIEKLASEHYESFYEDGNGAIEEYSFKPTQLLQFAEAYHAEQQQCKASSLEHTATIER